MVSLDANQNSVLNLSPFSATCRITSWGILFRIGPASKKDDFFCIYDLNSR